MLFTAQPTKNFFRVDYYLVHLQQQLKLHLLFIASDRKWKFSNDVFILSNNLLSKLKETT